MKKNSHYESRVLSCLRNGKPAIGSWINTSSPIVGELMAGCGFDFLTVDVEHSPAGVGETQSIFQAVRSGNPDCDCLVRLHGVDYSHVKRFLDSGANGVIAPLVETREDVETLVAATKYPPVGRRGVGFCRASRYGLNIIDYVENVNDQMLLALQIESATAVEKIDDLLSVDGVDAVFLGPYDLSASLGVTAQFDHPAYIEARDKVLEACKKHGIAAGIHVVQPDPAELLEREKEGYQLLAYSLDITMLTKACSEGLETIRAGIS
ncbi:MAG: 2,4-dihydroxyhept-2-ene-1,7-dioic acid aldolase [Verrucomicrobiales bacterium]|nr:2,4-dihydroxyhept-2-ene-1,7-dioic acid aldolase [Verrucomicrobiales bacterium]